MIRHIGYADLAAMEKKRERNVRLFEIELAEAPLDPETHFHRGWVFAHEGRHAEAIIALNVALPCLAFDELRRKALGLLARSYWLYGERAAASEVVGAGRAEFPDDLELLFVEAQIRLAAGDLTGAELSLRRVLADGPARAAEIVDWSVFGANGHYLLALALSLQGRHKDAEQYARATVAEAPDSILPWLVLADAIAAQGQQEDLPTVVEMAPATVRPVLVACSLALQGDATAAVEAIEASGVEPRLRARLTRWAINPVARVLDVLR
jgi:tetratricopeptide (TPR) repeat protein